MKVGKNYITIVFCLLFAINLAIFFYRDKFAYHKFATYSSLYSPGTAKWKKMIEDYPAQELIEAKIILDSLGITRQPTILKIQEIGKLLYNRFHKQAGHSSAQLSASSPLNQYKLLRSSDTVQLWCGNFASMFAFFCWSEGIPCRLIEIMNPGDHHVINECYLRETSEWVMTDVINNNLLLWSKDKNSYVNLLTLRDSLAAPLFALQATDSSTVTVPFRTGFYNKYLGEKNPINYYYRINNLEIYKTGEKIKRYLLPVAWYEEVGRPTYGNLPFYTKQSFILLWLISLILLIRRVLF